MISDGENIHIRAQIIVAGVLYIRPGADITAELDNLQDASEFGELLFGGALSFPEVVEVGWVEDKT